MVVALVGASGKLGSVVSSLLKRQHLIFPVDLKNAEYRSLNDIPYEYDIIIDVSCPQQSVFSVQNAVENKIPIVIACTGHSEEQLKLIKKCAEEIPVFLAYNMAVGAEVFKEASVFIAERFSSDVHIHEQHHKFKKDAPSGTAVELKRELEKTKNDVSTSSARGGDVVGTHEVSFYGQDELIKLTHIAENREVFARGICKVAEYVRCQRPGFYSMADFVDNFTVKTR